jgi:(p)ppGpp synthase/HD superfamily hydrolase
MLYTELTKKAMLLAWDMHLMSVDKGGMPYIFHPIAVAEMMGSDEYAICVALLHDIVEDTPMTIHQLSCMHFPTEIVEAVDAITRRTGEKYMDYLVRVKDNQLARKVKLGDLQHNSDLGRLRSIDKEALSLQKRYKKALIFLTDDQNGQED